MKLLSIIPLLLSAGIAVSQVSANPLRVVVVNEHVKTTNGLIRFGHAANGRLSNPHPNVATMHTVTGVHMKHKHGCAGSLRNKAKKVANWFRIVFHIGPASPNDVTVKTAGIQTPNNATPLMILAPVHDNHHFSRLHSFSQRLTHALMMLGPWEGRAIAFILGCGIGVLIRMFWVLAIVAIRAVRSKRQREEFIEDEVLFEEDEHLLAPPQYAEEYAVTVVEKEEKEVPCHT